jgi:endonuclease/exonuclease/phosphatase family metal-dependent hydrolase
VRVLVYNVRGFRHGRDRVAAVVRRLSPDVILMTESDGRLRLGRFARSVGMRACADPWSPLRRRVKNAVLVRPPWEVLEHRLVRFTGSERFYPRGALLARLQGPDLRAWAVAVHLGLRPRERRRHVRELLLAVRGLEDPQVVGGDLNERPDGRAVTALTERLDDAWTLGGDAAGETFPAAEPTARIDYLFVSPGVRVERAIVPPIPDVRVASDHRPVLADLSLPTPG